MLLVINIFRILLNVGLDSVWVFLLIKIGLVILCLWCIFVIVCVIVRIWCLLKVVLLVVFWCFDVLNLILCVVLLVLGWSR